MASPAVRQSVDKLIKMNKVMMFSKSYCPYCTKAKKVFKEIGQKYELVELDEDKDGGEMQQYLGEMTGARSVPRVFINGKCIGGGDETASLYRNGKLKTMLAE